MFVSQTCLNTCSSTARGQMKHGKPLTELTTIDMNIFILTAHNEWCFFLLVFRVDSMSLLSPWHVVLWYSCRCYCTAQALQLMTGMQGWAKKKRKNTVKAKRWQPKADFEKQQHVPNGCFQLDPLKGDFEFKDSNKWCKTNTTIRKRGWQHRMENGRKTEKPSICLKELRRKKREKKLKNLIIIQKRR